LQKYGKNKTKNRGDHLFFMVIEKRFSSFDINAKKDASRKVVLEKKHKIFENSYKHVK